MRLRSKYETANEISAFSIFARACYGTYTLLEPPHFFFLLSLFLPSFSLLLLLLSISLSLYIYIFLDTAPLSKSFIVIHLCIHIYHGAEEGSEYHHQQEEKQSSQRSQNLARARVQQSSSLFPRPFASLSLLFIHKKVKRDQEEEIEYGNPLSAAPRRTAPRRVDSGQVLLIV